ncbi:MAG: class I SAM-dependent methyltransferase [Spirochaetaceae bacterium]|jgi:2-polyprenyl-3-methyl-5-hydroxy-6-metoxy-1,4-benzoquinol methylase|nr:class I SAM-dependent methyltransferase [Spirochaetaceae bacterium]
MHEYKTWSTPFVKEEQIPIPCTLCGGIVFKPRYQCSGFSYVECKRCHLVQQNPQPESSAVLERYQNENYLRYELKNEQAFLRLGMLGLNDAGIVSIEKRNFQLGKNRFLDVGCATGALLTHLRDRGWQACGVEPNPAQAEFARSSRALDVRTSTLEDAGFAPSSFDILHASHVIEHLNKPSFFVQKAFEILRPGGFFIVVTPNIAGFQARVFKEYWRSAIFDHLYLFSRNTLKSLLIKHGFVVEKTVTWGGLAAGIAPLPLKNIADRAAKLLNIGDVMLFRARKPG